MPAQPGLRADHPRHPDAGHGRLRDRGADPRSRAQLPDPDHLPDRVQSQRHAGAQGLRPRRGRLPVQADLPGGPALEGQRVRRPVPQDRGGSQAIRAAAGDREERARAAPAGGEAALGGRAAASASRAGAPDLAGPRADDPRARAGRGGPAQDQRPPAPARRHGQRAAVLPGPQALPGAPLSPALGAPRVRDLQLLSRRAQSRSGRRGHPAAAAPRVPRRHRRGRRRRARVARVRRGHPRHGRAAARGIGGTRRRGRGDGRARPGQPARVRLLPDDGGRPPDRHPRLRYAHAGPPRGRRDRRPAHRRRPVGDGARAGAIGGRATEPRRGARGGRPAQGRVPGDAGPRAAKPARADHDRPQDLSADRAEDPQAAAGP